MRAIWIVPVIVSILILGLFGAQEAFASHVFVITPSSTQIGPVGTSQTFDVDIQNVGGFRIFAVQGCPAPATDRVGPFLKINTVPPSTTKVIINSDTPGTFNCFYSVNDGTGRGSHTSTLAVTAIFQPLPPPTICGSGTTLNTNVCVADVTQSQLDDANAALATAQTDLADCQNQNSQLTGDLAQCQADNSVLTQDLTDGQTALAVVETALAAAETALNQALDDLAAALLRIVGLEVTIAEGTVFSATNVAYNIIIEPGQITTITDGTTLSGNVFVNGGTLNLLGASTVTGNIETTQAGSIINMQQSSVNGNVLVDGAQSVNIDGNTIDGSLTIVNTIGSCIGDDTNNTVDGSTLGCP